MEDLVMLCARVPRGVREDARAAAKFSGLSFQEWVREALLYELANLEYDDLWAQKKEEEK